MNRMILAMTSLAWLLAGCQCQLDHEWSYAKTTPKEQPSRTMQLATGSVETANVDQEQTDASEQEKAKSESEVAGSGCKCDGGKCDGDKCDGSKREVGKCEAEHKHSSPTENPVGEQNNQQQKRMAQSSGSLDKSQNARAMNAVGNTAMQVPHNHAPNQQSSGNGRANGSVKRHYQSPPVYYYNAPRSGTIIYPPYQLGQVPSGRRIFQPFMPRSRGYVPANPNPFYCPPGST